MKRCNICHNSAYKPETWQRKQLVFGDKQAVITICGSKACSEWAEKLSYKKQTGDTK